MPVTTPISRSPAGDIPLLYLRICADAVDDIERARIALCGQIKALREVKHLAGMPEERRLEALVAGLRWAEKGAVRELERAMGLHPLGPWVKRTPGLGLKQAARLLAAIGDPAARSNVAKLWQYAGHGDPERSRRRAGRKCEYSPEAKVRVHLVAEQATLFDGKPDKNGKRRALSPYRSVYDRERAKWADRDVIDGHKHNHALRVVGKEILKDLWVEARRVQGTSDFFASSEVAKSEERAAA